MAGEWTMLPLGRCVAALIDYRGKTPKKTAYGVPLVTAKVVKNGRIDTPDEFISEDDYESWMRRGLPKAGDVVITTEAPLGEVAQLGPDRIALAQRLITLRGQPKILDNTFLKFLLQSDDVQDQLRARASGSTVLGIKQSELRKVVLTLPPLPEQRAIAHILGTLDDKIELNRRRNQTLEAMARALFKDWFVDFGPVRARMEGREPYLPADLWNRFPDRLDNGGKPEGWEVKPLLDLTTLITKGTTPTKENMNSAPESDAQITYVRVNSIDEKGFVIDANLTSIPKSVHAGVLKRSILKSNDILYTIAGTIGRMAVVEEWLLPANTNQAVAIIRPQQIIPVDFLIQTLRQEGFREELHNSIVQAVQANLSLGTLAKARVIVPPEHTLAKIFSPIDNIFSMIRANRGQSRTLAQIHDTLLPKLISGELRIADAEALLHDRVS